MAQPKIQAVFFTDQFGNTFPKAPPLLDKLKRYIYERDKEKCQKCGTNVRFGGTTISPWDITIAGHVDHILPRARGGQNTHDNLQLLCITCNAAKGAK